MATKTTVLASMDGGLFALSFDYDDVSMSILTIHVVNTNTRPYSITATSTSTGKVYSIAVQANTTVNKSIPTNQANRLGLSVTPSGKLDGVEWSIF